MASAVPLASLATGVIWLAQPGGSITVPTGRQVLVYERGTTTQVQVFADSGLSQPLAQPLLTQQGAVPGFIAAEQQVDLVDVLSGNRFQAEPLAVPDVLKSTPSGVQQWASNTAYVVNQMVFYQGVLYSCAITHTSGSSFAAANWTPINLVGRAYTITTSNSAWPIPPGARLLKITCVGGGGGGGGAGSAGGTSPVANQYGGNGGNAAVMVQQYLAVGGVATATVVIGAGGIGGAGGAAGGNPGAAGGNGGQTSIAVGTATIAANGGGGGTPSGANQDTGDPVNKPWGVTNNFPYSANTSVVGQGASGVPGGDGLGIAGGAGGSGQLSSSTNGGIGGGAGTTIGGSYLNGGGGAATASGGNGETATYPGAGGGGGGGGAVNGTGGAGGAGAPGIVIIEVVG